jgi:hypothetical protein
VLLTAEDQYLLNRGEANILGLKDEPPILEDNMKFFIQKYPTSKLFSLLNSANELWTVFQILKQFGIEAIAHS